MNGSRTAVFLAVVTMCVPRSGLSQASPCLAQADSVTAYRRAVSGIFELGDSVSSVNAGGPWSSLEHIQIVTDPSVCALGVAAFNQMAGYVGTGHEEAVAYVLAIGGTGYAIVRPGDTTSGGRRHVFLFTSNWQFVAIIAS